MAGCSNWRGSVGPMVFGLKRNWLLSLGLGAGVTLVVAPVVMSFQGLIAKLLAEE